MDFENIASYHMGNGLSVCDKSKEVNGDYKNVAHISPTRTVQFYGRVSNELKEHVFNIARTDNRNISFTQSQKVFLIEPDPNLKFELRDKIYHPVK